jgi:hypothetical protein
MALALFAVAFALGVVFGALLSRKAPPNDRNPS